LVVKLQEYASFMGGDSDLDGIQADAATKTAHWGGELSETQAHHLNEAYDDDDSAEIEDDRRNSEFQSVAPATVIYFTRGANSKSQPDRLPVATATFTQILAPTKLEAGVGADELITMPHLASSMAKHVGLS
jgi:hypothetical protein